MKDQNQTDNTPVAADFLDVPGGDNKGFMRRERRKTDSALSQLLATPQGKTISTALVTLLVVVMLIFFAITPALSSISTQLEKNTQLTDVVSRQDAKYNSILALQTKEQSLAEPLTKFAQVLSEDKHQAEIYTELHKLVTQNGLSFQSLRFTELTSVPAEYEELGISERAKLQRAKLIVTGGFTGGLSLLKQIEESSRIFDVEDLAITASPDGQQSASANGQLIFDFSLRTIYWERVE
jgi:Tfp pilus assembly protein PilO